MAVVPSLGSTAGGTAVIVYGVSFHTHGSMPGVCQCIFGNISVPGLIVNSTAIECKSPASILAETVPVSIIIDGYRVFSNIFFTFVSPPIIDSFSPAKGFTTGSSNITVYGSSFSSHAILCLFGLLSTTGRFVSESIISCVSPSQSVGNVSFSLIISGIPSSISTAHVARTSVWRNDSDSRSLFLYEASPTAHAISHYYCWPNQSTTVNVMGKLFSSTNRVPRCTIGNELIQCTILSDTDLACETGLLAEAGQVIFSVGYENEIPMLVNNFSITAAPHVIAISPLQISSEGGGLLQLFGENLHSKGTIMCHFGDVAADVYLHSDYRGACRIPPTTEGVTLFTISELLLGVIFNSSIQSIAPPMVLGATTSLSEFSIEVTLDVQGSASMLVSDLMRDSWYCQVDSTRTKALYVQNGRFLCSTTGVILSNSTTVILRDNSGEFQSNSKIVEVFKAEPNMMETSCGECDSNTGAIYYTDMSAECRTQCLDLLQIDSTTDLSYRSSMSIFNGRKMSDPPFLDSSIISNYDYDDYYGDEDDSNYFPHLDPLHLTADGLGSVPLDSVCTVNKNIPCFSPLSFRDFIGPSAPLGEDSVLEMSHSTEQKILSNATSTVEELRLPTDMSETWRRLDAHEEYLIVDSVHPSAISRRNYTRVTVIGRSFSNDTKCYLNNQTSATSYYISPRYMQCVVPPIAIIRTNYVTLSLRNVPSRGHVTGSSSINTVDLFYDDFEAPNRSVPLASPSATANRGVDIFKSDAGECLIAALLLLWI